MKIEAAERRAGEKLRQRILSAFPAGHYSLDAFFRLTDVVESTKIPTAAVECFAAPRMLLNPDFIAEYCKTDEHLFMLIMHELHHLLLGHTRLFQRHTPLDNIVFDAVINALLSMLFPQEMYISFFKNIYKPDQLPECLLRPPDGWPEKWNIPKILPRPVREMIRVLYSEASGTYSEVYDLLQNDQTLRDALSQTGISEQAEGQQGNGSGGSDSNDKDGFQSKCGGTTLLGDHSPEETPGRGESAANNPALNGIVRQIVEKWPMPPDPIRGRSVGGDLREIILQKAKQPKSADRVMRKLIKKMVEMNDQGGTTRRSCIITKRRSETPIPTLRDRRAFVSSAFGWEPLIYRSVIPERRVRRESGLTTLYVDVSGSTRSYWELLAALVRPYVKKKVARVFVFSEVVDEVTPGDLAKGKFKTTGGTDANCIWDHSLENGFKKIILVTDGYVGAPSREWKKKLSEARIVIRTALTPDGYLPDLEDVCEEIVELPEFRA